MITINNKSYIGKTITITGGKIIVDGKDVTPDSKEINITVEGNIDQLTADVCNKITVSGNTGSIKTQSGDIDIKGYVDGSIQTMSGDVHCGDVKGSVRTMSGDIVHR